MGMAEDIHMLKPQFLEEALGAELAHIRQLGANENLAFSSYNLSAYEALLLIIQSGERGLPVYQAVANVRTPFSGPAGVINRLKTMRELGILEERPGKKKSQICLVPSKKFLQDLNSVLVTRHFGVLKK